MKKYILKQWYPSLGSTWIIGDIAVKSTWDYYHHIERPNGYLPNEIEVENNPDFWELFEEEKSFLVTEDGVYIYEDEWEMFAVEKRTFRKISILSSNLMRHLYLLFNEEANADEYIWRNKPLFSYEDFIKWRNVPYEWAIEQLAKERIEDENRTY